MYQAGEVQVITRAAWLIILLLLTTASVHGDGSSLAIESHVAPSEASLGEPVRLTVVLKNVSDESKLLLVRDANFVVEVESAGGIETINSPRYTRRVSSFKDDEVPLRPGDAFTRQLPVQLNDLRATLGEGWISAPGAYRIRVRYDSERSARERSALVWRGSVTSPWEDVHIRVVSENERMHQLNEIKSCIGSDECSGVEVANFFRVVQDQRSPDLLLRLIEKRPFNIWLLDAIVFQSRASDAKRLRDLASNVDDPSIRQKFIDAAVKLERSVERRAKT